MDLEYLASGSPDCPLLRLFRFTSAEARELRSHVLSLAQGTIESLSLDALVHALDGCRVMLRRSDRDIGVQATAPLVFDWSFTPAAWRQVADLIEPFCDESPRRGYQWLCDDSDVLVLLSRDGKW